MHTSCIFWTTLIRELVANPEDSDEDMYTVPDVEATPNGVHSTVTIPNSNLNQSNGADPQLQTGFAGKRRQRRNPADKEHRRLRR